MRTADYLKAKLFEIAYKESNGKAGLYGLIIAHCLANRVRRNMGTWTEVLANVPKYRANEPVPVGEPNLYEPLTQRLLQDIDGVYENTGEDLANGGLYWCFTENGANEWFREFVISRMANVATQNSLKVFGEKTYIGQGWDKRGI